MIGTITYILARAGWRAMNGTIADERRRLAGAEPPAAYVSYDPRLLAGVGWYGYRIAFKGGDRQMIERARYMLSELYTIRDSYEYYADGVYVIGVLMRQRVPHYGIGGAQPAPVLEDYLNFTMPNGGTVTLKRNGSPTVVDLEYSLDDRQTWTDWQEVGNVRTLTMTAGQKVWLRNKSETQTGFSTITSDYYQFAFTNTVEAHGNINSLLCKNAESVTSLSSFCFRSLFYNCTSLITSPNLPATGLADNCYRAMFEGCSFLLTAPELRATVLVDYCYYYMFYRCIQLHEVRTHMTNISAAGCIANWTEVVSPTGDFYCDQNLTIPTGGSGIPSGWTRHDI